MEQLTKNPVFFFQAEDGIRDTSVTGVQTCALPIWRDVVFGDQGVAQPGYPHGLLDQGPDARADGVDGEIGRASCRERVKSQIWTVLLKNKELKNGTTHQKPRCRYSPSSCSESE